MKCMMTICLLTLLFVGSAVAETYVWEDATGTLNFTEDLSQVPKKYRKKVRVRGDMSAPTPEQSSAATEPGSAKSSSSTPAASAAEKPVVGSEKKDLQYGGRNGEEWRREFAYLKADIKSTDDQIAEMNGRLADTSQMSRSDYLNINSTLKSLQLHKVEVGKKLDALSQAASKAGVPAEFR